MIRKTFSSLFLTTLVLVTFSFAQDSGNTDFSIDLGKGTLTLPYKVNFTQAEINFLKTLDEVTLKKIVQVALQVKTKNLQATNSSTNQNPGSNTQSQNTPTTYSNTPSSQTPYYNPQTRQYQSTPAANQSYPTNTNQQPTIVSSEPTSQTPYYNPQTGNFQNVPAAGGGSGNPYLPDNSGYSGNPYLGGGSGYSSSGSGGDQTVNQVANLAGGLAKGYLGYDKDLDIKDIDPLCKPNYGVDVTGSCPDIEHATTQLKNTTMKACTAVKKRLKSSSVFRNPSCNSKVGGASESSHVKGMAIDLSYKNLNSEERVKVFRVFKINGFDNLGCYSSGGAIHLDHRPGGPRRWGSSYSSSSYNSANCPGELKLAGY